MTNEPLTKEQKIHDLAIAYAMAEYKETRDYLRSRHEAPNNDNEDISRNAGGEATLQGEMMYKFYEFYTAAVKFFNQHPDFSCD